MLNPVLTVTAGASHAERRPWSAAWSGRGRFRGPLRPRSRTCVSASLPADVEVGVPGPQRIASHRCARELQRRVFFEDLLGPIISLSLIALGRGTDSAEGIGHFILSRRRPRIVLVSDTCHRSPCGCLRSCADVARNDSSEPSAFLPRIGENVTGALIVIPTALMVSISTKVSDKADRSDNEDRSVSDHETGTKSRRRD